MHTSDICLRKFGFSINSIDLGCFIVVLHGIYRDDPVFNTLFECIQKEKYY